MVTARRSNETSRTMYEQSTARGGVQVLERPLAYEEFAQVSVSDAAAERRKNLNDLLNYDRYSAEVVVDAPINEPVKEKVENVVNSAYVLDDVDIRPTSTTMQFGDIDAGEIQNEMKSEVTASEGYKLSGKGKVLVVLYSLVVAVVMALIMINTGVLNGLNTAKAETLGVLSEKQGIYAEIVAENNKLANPENIIEWAESNGMIK